MQATTSFFILLLSLLSAFCFADESIEKSRETLDSIGFAAETKAQRHGTVITRVWDDLRAKGDFLAVAKSLPAEIMTAPDSWQVRDLWSSAFGEITRLEASVKTKQLSQNQSLDFLSSLHSAGWILEESEWHHLKFVPASGEHAAHSTINVTFHAKNPKLKQRAILRGHLEVVWSSSLPITWSQVDVTDLKIYTRTGEAPFRIANELRASQLRPLNPENLHPILVDDLDGDSLPDISLGGANIVLRNQGNLSFQTGDLLPYTDALSPAAVFGDFDGDGHRDILAVGTADGLLRVYQGLPIPESGAKNAAHFSEGKRAFEKRFSAAQALTTADIDGDGDLDAFLTQYKPPFQGGTMPYPFYDANDGYPAFLLLNDGKGHFSDATETSGLASKRHRRNYAASFVDLDCDSKLDLVLTSDFAGIDLFQGNGKGQFSERTKDWLTQPRLFGMSHVIADLNRDERPDLYAIGMASTTARRLEEMNAGVPAEQKITAQRAAMGYGNRLYLNIASENSPSFDEPEFGHDLAESGWSWGASVADLDNNGLPDFYIANGHISGKSASDYCSTFWRHDIYTPNRRKEGQDFSGLFARKLKPLIEFETSWNGYEHNAAFMQKSPGEFVNLSYLMGISNEGDSRAVISTDLDRDGDIDLLVTILEPRKDVIHRLVVYENLLKAGKNSTNWIGVDLGGPNANPWNAVITLVRSDGSREIAPLTTGGSFASQMPTVKHFGIGSDLSVQAIEIKWPDGRVAQIDNPPINQWHLIPSSQITR